MRQNCSRLRAGAAIRFSLIAFTALAVIAVMPSPAEAQGACTAAGSIGPAPLGNFTCSSGLQVGEQLDIIYTVFNNSTTNPGGVDVAADLRGIVTNLIACEDSDCKVEIPTAFVFVPGLPKDGGCQPGKDPGVASCTDGGENTVLVTMTPAGVQIPPGGMVSFVTIRVEVVNSVGGEACGLFFTRADSDNGLVIHDDRCFPLTADAGGSSIAFSPICRPDTEDELCADDNLCTAEVCNIDFQTCDSGLCSRTGDECTFDFQCNTGTCIPDPTQDVVCLPGFCFTSMCEETSGLCLNTDISDQVCPDDAFFCADQTCNEVTDQCDIDDLSDQVCPPDAFFCATNVCDEGVDQCVQSDISDQVCPPDDFFCATNACDEGVDQCVQSDISDQVCPPDDFFCATNACDEGVDQCVQSDISDQVCPPDDFFCATNACDEGVDQCVQSDISDQVCPPDDFFCATNACDEGTDACVQSDISDQVCPPDDFFCATNACDEGVDQCVQSDISDQVCPPDDFFCADQACDEEVDQCVQTDISDQVCPPDDFFCATNACDEGTDACVQSDISDQVCPPDDFFCATNACDEEVDQCVQSDISDQVCPPDDFFCADQACDEDVDQCVQTDTSDQVCPPDDFFCATNACDEEVDQCVQSDISDQVCPPDDFFCATNACDEGTDACVQSDISDQVCPPDDFFCATNACDEGTDACVQSDISDTVCPPDEFFCADQACDEDVDQCVQTDISDQVCDLEGTCYTETCNEDTDMCDRDCDPAGNPDECQVIIGDFIWDDDNQDGIQDGGEMGFDAVDVSLIDCSVGETIEDMTSTDSDGVYGFTVDAVDANCEPETRDFLVEIDPSNFAGGGPLNGYDGSPMDQGGDDSIDSDCDVSTAKTTCDAFPAGTEDTTIDCGFFREDRPLICRTPGFWGTHAKYVDRDPPRQDSYNITQAVIDEVGFLSVCGGLIIDDTDLQSMSSALEAMCVRVQGEQIRQLIRQMTALSLNCAVSGWGADCSFGDQQVEDLFAACDTACMGGVDFGTCIDDIDCINNGGVLAPDGSCSMGTCEHTFEVCGEDAGSCAPAAQACEVIVRGGIIGGQCSITGDLCADEGECPLVSQDCVPYQDNCHDRELCPCDENGDDQCLEEDGEDPDGLCFVPPGSAGSGRMCRGASKNDCFVYEPGSCDNP